MKKKVNLSSFTNSWYRSGNFFKRIIWYFLNELILKNTLIPWVGLKIFFLRLFGAKIGKGVMIKPGVNIKYPWNLSIGNHVWVGENVWIDNLAKTTIEDNVCISQGAILLCGNHNYKKSTFDLIIGEIILEEGSWVGAKSMVCPGVRLKTHAILAVGSVANKDLESYAIYQGNPAIRVRARNMEEEL
jgi:putative colanic acid biosynthesis acetyltransferase WcaF